MSDPTRPEFVALAAALRGLAELMRTDPAPFNLNGEMAGFARTPLETETSLDELAYQRLLASVLAEEELSSPRTTTAPSFVVAPRLIDLLPEYEGHLRGKGHRPRGREKYIWTLKGVIRWLGEEATVADLTEDRILAYRDARAFEVKAATVFNELVCIRSLCKWCVRKRWLSVDPTQYVDYPKMPRPSPRALTRVQLKLLFQIIDTEPKTYKARWRRNRIALLLIVYTGLRIGEAAGLLWKDVDIDAGVIVVRPEIAKNGKTRAIPLHPRLKDELSRLSNQEPDTSVIPRAGKQPAGTPMGPKSVAHIFERWLAGQGLRITPHQLRHTLATEMLRAGAPLPDIQNILGHESLETTAIYLTIDAEHLRGAINMLPSGW